MKYIIILLTTLFLNVTYGTNDSIVVQLKWEHQFQFAGYYIAKEKGFYDDVNLNVILKEGSSSCNTLDSVLTKKADFGIGGSELLIEKNKGKAIRVLLSIYQHSPMVLIAKDVPSIQNIHDIIGKKVMLEKNSIELQAYLTDEGINKNSLIQYPFKNNVLNLINDSVEFISSYITDEPYFLKKNNIDYQIFKPQSAGIDFYSDILFTSNAFIQSNSKEINAFIEATKKGWNYAIANIDETVSLIHNNYSNQKEISALKYEAVASKKLIRNDIIEIGYMYEGRWQHIGETYVKLGLLSKDFKTKNFIYDNITKQSRFGLITKFFDGLLILSCIIGLISISYFIFNLLNKKRLKKQLSNDK